MNALSTESTETAEDARLVTSEDLINKTMAKQFYEKKSKYKNEPITVDGVRYDSKNEFRRHCYLKLLERAGEIKDLKYHVIFELIPQITREEIVHLKTKDKVVTRVEQQARLYEADFTYTVVTTGEEVVEDFKGDETDLFKFKAALFFYLYKKHIKIVKHINEPI